LRIWHDGRTVRPCYFDRYVKSGGTGKTTQLIAVGAQILLGRTNSRTT
jgi:hypothetical protein